MMRVFQAFPLLLYMDYFYFGFCFVLPCIPTETTSRNSNIVFITFLIWVLGSRPHTCIIIINNETHVLNRTYDVALKWLRIGIRCLLMYYYHIIFLFGRMQREETEQKSVFFFLLLLFICREI